jgi:hypothetical protein
MVCRAANLLFENLAAPASRRAASCAASVSNKRWKLQTQRWEGWGLKNPFFFALRCEKTLSGDNTLLIDDFIQEAFLISGHLAPSTQSSTFSVDAGRAPTCSINTRNDVSILATMRDARCPDRRAKSLL